jgi:hypothetical protein
MFKAIASVLSLSALLAVPTTSHALIYTFNASLAGSKEVPVGSGATATGTAILDYDDKGTLSLADDTYNFSMSAFGLTGGTTAGTAASAFHIHGAATTAENGPVRIGLDAAPFASFNSGSTLLVGGNNVVAPTTLFTTPASGTNVGYPAMSFLAMLRANLTYVNVHTAANPGGAIRGQLIEVTVVPEPSTYAMFLAGLGVVGLVWRRRAARQT